MPGAPEPLYVAARRTLLDALEAVREHLDAIALVGAQAVYVHTGEGELEVAPYTTDGDLALDPGRLRPHPLIESLLEGAELEVAVAEPLAPLAANIYKIEDRASDPDRRTDKDALDVFRPLQAASTLDFGPTSGDPRPGRAQPRRSSRGLFMLLIDPCSKRETS